MVLWIILQLLFVVVASHASSNSTVLCHHHERDALLAFKMGFNISSTSSGACYMEDEYAKTKSWSGSECCKWDGVTCNPRTGHVVELDLTCSLLTGSFPPNTTLFLLPHLHHLSLANNFLSGQVPPEIGRISKLTTLDLSYNGLEGIIPGWIFTLPSILVLELSDNQFTAIGQFETRNCSSLTLFNAENNRLQGEIPNSIFELHNLQELVLGSNSLTGTIPLSRIHKLQSMKMLFLSDNRLSIIDDMVSDSTPSWPSFEGISLSSCNLSHFPGFLREQVNLMKLELSNNGIQGMVPDWLMDMSNLDYLNISHNFLSAGLEHLPWKSMTVVDIQYNSFQGVVHVPSPIIFLF